MPTPKKLTKKEKDKLRKAHYKKIKRVRITSITVFIIISLMVFGYFIFLNEPSNEEIISGLNTLNGFKVNVFTDNINLFNINFPGPNIGPRMMAVWGDMLFVAAPRKGKVYVFRDLDGDGVAEEKTVFMRGLKKPHSVAFYQDWVYIAEEHQVVRVNWDTKKRKALRKTEEVIVSGLPTGGTHWTRTISIYDEQLYVSIGSSCNNCEEKDALRGKVIQCELDRDVCDPFAYGVRNAVGLEWYNDTLFSTENGRDWLGDDFPPDEINILSKGKDYGWPYCHARNEPDPDLGTLELCDDMELPAFDIQAHSAPLGLAFYSGEMYPSEFVGDLFVAYHGSWNRKKPTGYKVVRMFVDETPRGFRIMGAEDFVSGWMTKTGDANGRPVDVINWIDGSLLVSDDKAGVVYRISYDEDKI